MYNDLNKKFENEKNSLSDLINQKKDLNETIINLEKQVNKFINKFMGPFF